MSVITRLLDRLTGRRTAQRRWDERWSDPSFYESIPVDELAHYSVLAGYAKALRPGGSVLDVGCGDGTLRSHLHADTFSAYVGTDFPEAIARAATRADSRTSFVAGDMRAFAPAMTFDVIVFNESLYYVDDPIGELVRYGQFMKPGGVFLVSMHRKAKSDQIWSDISRRFTMIDRVTVANRRGVEWTVGAFEPASPR